MERQGIMFWVFRCLSNIDWSFQPSKYMVYILTPNWIAFGTQWDSIFLEKARNTAGGQLSIRHYMLDCSLDGCNSCIFRNPPVHSGSDVYLPASFPPECLQNDPKLPPLVLSDEDRGEVCFHKVIPRSLFTHLQLHSLLVYANSSCFILARDWGFNSLQKYVTFSQVSLPPLDLSKVLIIFCRHFCIVRFFFAHDDHTFYMPPQAWL